eukprot:9571170-Ditylum_brightwellii.AAC.2
MKQSAPQQQLKEQAKMNKPALIMPREQPNDKPREPIIKPEPVPKPRDQPKDQPSLKESSN